MARRGRTAAAVAGAGLVAAVTIGVLFGAPYIQSHFLASSPHGGLSRGAAIEAATRHVTTGSQEPVSVTSAEIRRDFDTGFGLPIHRWSWVVTFRGHWSLICTGNCEATSEWVAVDYYTGGWIASQYSYQRT